jgi:membrane protease YdiL (CAAX protease family)
VSDSPLPEPPPPPPAEPPPLPPAEPPAAPPEERYPFWGYSDVLLFAGLTIPCMVAGFTLAKVLLFALQLIHMRPISSVAVLLVGQSAGYLFLFGSLVLMFRVHYGRPLLPSLGWTDLRRPFGGLVLAGFATALGVNLLGLLIQTPTTTNPMMQLLHDRTAIILVGIFGVTIGPVCEELAFRGLLQPLLVRSLGVVPGILAAAIPFGLLHLPEYGYSWRHGVLVTLAGAAFGWVRYSTRSVKAAALMHASYNAFFFIALISAPNLPGKG